MDIQAAALAFDAMTPAQKAEAHRLVKLGRDRIEVVKSLTKQSLAVDGAEAEHEASGSTTSEDVQSAAMGARDALLPGLKPTDILTAPMTLPLASTMTAGDWLAKQISGRDAPKEAQDQSPIGYAAGELGAAAATLPLGAGKGAAALAKGAKPSGAVAASVPKTPGALRRVMNMVQEEGGLKNLLSRKATSKFIDDDVAKAAFPKPSAPAAPAPSWMTALADDISPGGRVESGLELAPRAPKAKPAARGPKILDAVEDAPPKSLRAEAIERISVDDVGSAVPKAPTGPAVVAGQRVDAAKYKPQDGNVFLEQEAAKASEAAGRAWKSLPLSPVGQPKPGPLSTNALRAEARAAVARGESLVDLAARLGLNKTDRELVAVFKAAQIGN